MPRTSLIAIASACLLAVVIFPTPVAALTLTPIRFEISGDPGQVLNEEMLLLNETDNPQTYYASFANFEARGDTGSPTFVDPKDDLGTWITTDVASINLKPGQQKIVPFKITIPRDATPGGHFAALFWGTSPGGGSGQVSIGTKTGALILLSVNGNVEESAGLVDFQTNGKQWLFRELPVGFTYRFSNQGGDRVKPSGSVVIRSVFGWRVKKVNANPADGNVLPNTTRKFTPEWAKQDSVEDHRRKTEQTPYSFFQNVRDEWHNFAFGIFRARVVAQFGSSSETVKSKSAYFAVVPVELLVVIIVLGVPLFLLLRVFVRRYNRYIIKKAQKRFEKSRSV